MSDSTERLFTSVDLGGLRLPNRVVMAPMSRVRSTPEGLATAAMAAYYAQRASAGLIVTEGVHPNRVGQSNPLTPGLHTDEQTASWRQVTTAVHANGGRIFAQLMHGGRISHPDTTGLQPVGPSAVAARDSRVFTPSGPQQVPVPRALTTEEAGAQAAAFAHAARRAVAAGFDGVELHGANGYLIAQFLSSSANLRTDRYGGPVSGRIRFAVEAATAAAAAIGPQRVGIRLSPGAGLWDAHDTEIPELYGALLAELDPLGLAYLHLEATTDEQTLLGLRRAWSGPLIVNPSAPSAPVPAGPKSAGHWLGLGADLISFGRAFLANPDLVERLRIGLPLAEADPATFYEGGDTGYLTYTPYRY
ncbi:alkene reductase [Streptomonospora nanhaiensis]|uniref:N-ethylmaleimide reductase n=1 Tax=Streptomonospora nanhaiensis TaxID=1323731 RepID=A0A853BI99_9ACTN|nr:alkene reductase [Streptomonospora nanhaiensis]MBV2363165.1 alkene reductase [Streptomonospora nanhaiensis]MBX9387439.1 alkene reductase [Streptomonospora nanhaiensis]NYI94341.1 N-ethylmaleimide reductase [Streptomonospora nanhaiensis]